MTEEQKKKYYGTKVIQSTVETSDGAVVGILFEDGTSTSIPKWEAELLILDDPTNHIDERNIRCNYICGKILEILRDTDCKVNEITFLLEKIKSSLYDQYVGSLNVFMDDVINTYSDGFVPNQEALRLGWIDHMRQLSIAAKAAKK